MSDFINTFHAFPSSFRVQGLIAALAFFVCLIAAPSALALTYTVMTNADSGAGSLRQAVLDANGTAAADVIDFNIPAGSCPAGVCTITLASEISISNNGSLTITGTGAKTLIIDGGAGTNRIFYSDGATFTLSGVALTSGNGTGANFSGRGGSIFVNVGTTTVSGVYFSANTAPVEGGGIYFLNGTNHRVENSAFSGNTSVNGGGGINVNGANLTVVNTTLSGNSANGFSGGGIFASNTGTLTLRGDTITANTAGNGGGVYLDTGTLDFGNTIIAGNTATNGANSQPEIRVVTATATSQGYNLVGDSAGDSTDTQIPITYQSTDIQNKPPLLDPLADYGGTTPTRRLQTGSPAFDKGNSFGLTTDQRGAGFARPVNLPDATYPNAAGGDGSDIGAYEAQTAPAPPTAATVSVSGRVTTTDGRGIANARLSLTDSQGQVRTTTTDSDGYYNFSDVTAGETCIITATGKRYTFAQPSQFLNVSDDTTEVNFIGNSEKRRKVF